MSTRPSNVGRLVLLILTAIVAFLLLMPTKVQPVNWSPPKAPSLKDGPCLPADGRRRGAGRPGPWPGGGAVR